MQTVKSYICGLLQYSLTSVDDGDRNGDITHAAYSIDSTQYAYSDVSYLGGLR